jgi:hypothetical protein
VSAEDQIRHLKGVAADHGWTVVDVFTDRVSWRCSKRCGMAVWTGCCFGRSTELDGH